MKTENKRKIGMLVYIVVFAIFCVLSIPHITKRCKNKECNINQYFAQSQNTQVQFKDKHVYDDVKQYLQHNTYPTNYIVSSDDSKMILNIRNIDEIKVLELWNETGEENAIDLSGLEAFSNLEDLTIIYYKIKDISIVSKLSKLSSLVLDKNGISDIEPLKNLQNLTKLDLYDLELTNEDPLEPLKNLQNLKELDISGLDLSNESILEPITQIKSLQYLGIGHCKIDNIEILKKFPNITVLDIGDNPIQDYSPLEILTNLKILYVYMNNISNLEILPVLPNLETIMLEINKISDISYLTNYKKLKEVYLSENSISDLTPIKDLIIHAWKNEISDTVSSKIYNLPSIITLSQDKSCSIYTDKELILTNCTLSDDKKSIILNDGLTQNDEVKVQINGGTAVETLLTLKPSDDYLRLANANITYEKQENDDVIAKITFDKPNVTITNNDGKDTYTLKEGEEFTFEFVDENGTKGTKVAKVEKPATNEKDENGNKDEEKDLNLNKDNEEKTNDEIKNSDKNVNTSDNIHIIITILGFTILLSLYIAVSKIRSYK